MAYRYISLKWESFSHPIEICTYANIKFWYIQDRISKPLQNITHGLYSTNYKSFIVSWFDYTSFMVPIISFFQSSLSSNKESEQVWTRTYFSPCSLYFEISLINKIYGWGLVQQSFGAVLFYCSHSSFPLSLFFLMNWTFYLQKSICSSHYRKRQLLPNCISTSKIATIISFQILRPVKKFRKGKKHFMLRWTHKSQ